MTDSEITVTSVKQYRKKPVTIKAVQLGWDTWSEICEFMKGADFTGVYVHPTDDTLFDREPNWSDARIGVLIVTLEGEMFAIQGDYIIKGVAGEFYSCKPDIFALTYEVVGEM